MSQEIIAGIDGIWNAKKENTHTHKYFWKACEIKENGISSLITVFLLDYFNRVHCNC